jgi:multidrug transporter EmrE-like cation transporter
MQALHGSSKRWINFHTMLGSQRRDMAAVASVKAAAAVVSARKAHSTVMGTLRFRNGLELMLCSVPASRTRTRCCSSALASSAACWSLLLTGVTLSQVGVCVCYCIWSAVHAAVLVWSG